MTCSGWQSGTGATSDLTYQYSIGYRNTLNTQTFYSGTLAVSPPVTFPVGNSSDSYMSDVHVLVTDSLQDSALYVIEVQVSIEVKVSSMSSIYR